MIESLGAALRALHRVPVPADLLPPWLTDALSGKPWPAFHPPVVSATLQQLEAARRLFGHDSRLLADVLHGSHVIVDQGRVTGRIDFAEALAQPADVELDTILRWCARAREYPPVPGGRGLDETTLTETVPGERSRCGRRVARWTVGYGTPLPWAELMRPGAMTGDSGGG